MGMLVLESARPGRVCGVAARMSGCAAAPHGGVINPINLTNLSAIRRDAAGGQWMCV